MAWDPERLADVVEAYREHWHEHDEPDAARRRAARLRHEWVMDVVWSASMGHDDAEGDPVELVDALLADPLGDERYAFYVAAGPIEDHLTNHPEPDLDRVETRRRTDPRWAFALRGVWMDRAGWERLPAGLREAVPEPAAEVSRASRTSKRPSKRQGRRPRRG